MSVLDIRVLGDPILREETTPVGQVTDELRTLVKNMFETMYLAKGIGLAAPQVGRTERLAVIDVDDNPLVVINPEIIDARAREAKAEEGCLSIPDVYGDVERPARVRVRAMDLDGKTFEVEADGPARALPPARDRSSPRQAVHRLPERSQTTLGDGEVDEGEGQVSRLHSTTRDGSVARHTSIPTRSSECACSSGARPSSRCRRSAR